MGYCTPAELYNFLKLKIQYKDIENDLNSAITVASSRIDAQVGLIENPDEDTKILLKRACMYYAGAEILRQYWEELQVDRYEMQKVSQYEGMGDELTRNILNKLKGVQQITTSNDNNKDTKIIIPSFLYTITNR
ncbi:hypothetical protein [Methanothermococcus okinawensis]|uniref:Uncharacterized protein n=1 Tax=Methanothermococcus okinawensis (strain DSM 14208 / JCM 11175 / IH1) TaxID=647113 RepID=F8AKA2_METOI|nr:hypothetical protein [Methanothermococcus okinawensis]AEH06302.1 hypothetical protein Metok_0312 [Methanothermococcus okinawensis IH1]